MRIVLTEKWEYTEWNYWDVEELPDGWDDWDNEAKAEWTVNNAEYYRCDTEPYNLISIDDVEVR